MEDLTLQNSYRAGFGKGLPIALGYLSVAFGFGITSVSMGIAPLEAILISATNLTSAGQLAGISIIAAGGTILEMILTQLVINIRYCLMALALTQKLDSDYGVLHRLTTSFGITDEVFGVAASQKDIIGKRFMYGLITLPPIGWVLGTALGVYADSVLPESVCLALGIAIYSMFVAIVIPPARDDKGVLWTVILSSALSCMFFYVPIFSGLSQGFAIIICAFIVAGIMAYIAPREE